MGFGSAITGAIGNLFGGGSGGSKQTIKQKLMTDIGVSISAAVRNSCAAVIDGSQIIKIVGDNNVILNIEQEAYYSVSATCTADNQMLNEVIADITNKFTAEMKKNTDALTDAFKALVGSGDEQKMQNEINVRLSSALTAEVMNNCIAKISHDQVQIVLGNNNIYAGNTQKAMASSSVNCIASNEQVNNVLAEMFNQSKWDEDYEVKGPFDFLGNIVNVAIILFILIILLVAVYFLSRPKGQVSGGDESGIIPC